MADARFRRETPYPGPAVQYAVLLDGKVIGRVYGWDVLRDARGRWSGRDRVLRREWHSGTVTPWRETRAAAAADVLSGRSTRSGGSDRG